jgi:hypothetical protein
MAEVINVEVPVPIFNTKYWTGNGKKYHKLVIALLLPISFLSLLSSKLSVTSNPHSSVTLELQQEDFEMF